jgi:hypothetical protein
VTLLTTSSDNTLPPLGSIPLLLVEPDRAIEHAPSGVSVGMITLGAWHISRISRVPDSFDGYGAYLIRIPYDIDIDLGPGKPMPRQFEVGFTFATDGASVHDALPQRADARAGAGYLLNRQLTFAPQEGGAADHVMSDISLSEDCPGGQLLGRGTATVRWRHAGTAKTPLRPGAHVCWIVLLAPPGLTQIRVLAKASFTLPDKRWGGLREVALADAFIIALPGEQPGLSRRASNGGKQVFVSYVHESAGHKADVKALCDLLRAEGGATVLFDQDEPARRQDWQEWMTTGIIRSDYVLVVASPVYRAVGRYETGNVTRRGIDAEYRLLTTLLAEDYPLWLRKILPVVLPGRAVSEIPVVFQPYDADYYAIGSLTRDGISKLLETIGRELPP